MICDLALSLTGGHVFLDRSSRCVHYQHSARAVNLALRGFCAIGATLFDNLTKCQRSQVDRQWHPKFLGVRLDGLLFVFSPVNVCDGASLIGHFRFPSSLDHTVSLLVVKQGSKIFEVFTKYLKPCMLSMSKADGRGVISTSAALTKSLKRGEQNG